MLFPGKYFLAFVCLRHAISEFLTLSSSIGLFSASMDLVSGSAILPTFLHFRIHDLNWCPFLQFIICKKVVIAMFPLFVIIYNCSPLEREEGGPCLFYVELEIKILSKSLVYLIRMSYMHVIYERNQGCFTSIEIFHYTRDPRRFLSNWVSTACAYLHL